MKALGLTLLPRAARCIGLIQCSLGFSCMISIYKINANWKYWRGVDSFNICYLSAFVFYPLTRLQTPQYTYWHRQHGLVMLWLTRLQTSQYTYSDTDNNIVHGLVMLWLTQPMGGLQTYIHYTYPDLFLSRVISVIVYFENEKRRIHWDFGK